MREADRLLDRAKTKLKAARTLLDTGFPDDAVSRAYYAMLYAARALLVTIDLRPRTHRGVLRMVGLRFIQTGVLEAPLGEVLGAALEDREEADYGILSSITRDEAERVLADAHAFVARAEEVLEEGTAE